MHDSMEDVTTDEGPRKEDDQLAAIEDGALAARPKRIRPGNRDSQDTLIVVQRTTAEKLKDMRERHEVYDSVILRLIASAAKSD